MVQGFRDWLEIHRGASETTLSRYSAAAVELLSELGGDPGRRRAFLLERARRHGVGGAKAISSALRMFLRYLASPGKCRAGLDAAIPTIAGWLKVDPIFDPLRDDRRFEDLLKEMNFPE